MKRTLVRGYVIHELFTSVKEEHIQQAWRKDFNELVKEREIQYAESTEYASKEWRPLSGISTVEYWCETSGKC
jgi:hypothetical protein